MAGDFVPLFDVQPTPRIRARATSAIADSQAAGESAAPATKTAIE
jgi:hypothetical protein